MVLALKYCCQCAGLIYFMLLYQVATLKEGERVENLDNDNDNPSMSTINDRSPMKEINVNTSDKDVNFGK